MFCRNICSHLSKIKKENDIINENKNMDFDLMVPE